MSKFDLKGQLGNLVGDCSTYKKVEEIHKEASVSEWETNDLIEPERAFTQEEIDALFGAISVLK